MLMEVRNFIKGKKKAVICSSIFLFIGIVGVVSCAVYFDYRENKDIIAYEQIIEEYIQQRKDDVQKEKALEKTAAKLIDIVDSSVWGYIHDKGYYIIAGLYYNEKQYDEAKKYYLQFAEDASSVFAQMALSKAALCYEQQGDFNKAMEIYRQLEEEYAESPFLDQILYDLGRMYQKKGDIVKAKEYFNKVITADTGSVNARSAQKRLFVLARKID
jgi:tetratricopeptide (TPR) repeat protein